MKLSNHDESCIAHAAPQYTLHDPDINELCGFYFMERPLGRNVKV